MFRPPSVSRTIASSFVGLLFLGMLYKHCRIGGQEVFHLMVLVTLPVILLVILTLSPDSALDFCLNLVQCISVTFGTALLGLLVFRRKFVEALEKRNS